MITWQRVTAKKVVLSGVLSQNSVTELMPISQFLAGIDSPFSVELAELSHVDSAGLAYLVELKQIAKREQLALSYSGSTVALDKLVALYNAQSLLD